MNKLFKYLNLLSSRFFSTGAAGLYMILFAVAIGAATFIENDFGTSAAQKVVFKAWWFELLLVLFGVSIIVNIFRYKMIQQKKWSILLFHSAIIIILVGAGITRYIGSEGIMHIREGEETDLILSRDTYLQFEVNKNGNVYQFSEPVLFASLGSNRFKESYQLGDELIQIELVDYVPNPIEEIVDDPDGKSMIKVVMAGQGGREEHVIKEGDRVEINGLRFNFSDIPSEGAININYYNNNLTFSTDRPITQMVMATQQRDTLMPGNTYPLMLRSLYTLGPSNFVISEFQPSAKTLVTTESSKMKGGSLALLELQMSVNGVQEGNLKIKGGEGATGKPEVLQTSNGTRISASYGVKYERIPFSLKLRDFIMERYPGTNSASSYASEVTLLDPVNQVERDQRIFMNNILNYRGYRFFQSSFDQDEKGTVLSVNHDAPGTWISYLGYALLTLGMILTLFSKKSRFQKINAQLKKSKLSTAIVLVLLSVSINNLQAFQVQPIGALEKVEASHADLFGKVVVQDHRGRMKPVHTLASEVLRKLSRKENLYGMNPVQVFLGMTTVPEQWSNVPLIKVSKVEAVADLIGVDGNLASYNDFFKSGYILRDQVRKAYDLEAKDRGVFEKEIIKIDERVNICNMVFNGQLLKIFPMPADNNDQWLSPADVNHMNASMHIDDFARNFTPQYLSILKNKNWESANNLVVELQNYQRSEGIDIVPSSAKINAEIKLNQLNVFARVGRYYALIGLLSLILFFVLVFRSTMSKVWPLRLVVGALLVCFLFHTLGLGMRWYVSGRAPWSNGYESMIYIAWTTMLAGLIFTRRSLGGLAATSILSSTILMVAGLSWMDPEITPLVPVLKSYWLTIHVSLEAGSYGFLMLGAIIGVLNLILMIFQTSENRKRIQSRIKEMTLISEMTLIGGLFMISAGTYLGGVWANESWGRYWGWDAKETWALVTILVYSFILHMRFIPGFRGLYAFNVATLFGLASVLMTYFGVNYYLSGLHSYAAGDPVPIPSFVYYSVAVLIIISSLAFWRNKSSLKNKTINNAHTPALEYTQP